jgi:hypothetical protein
MANIKGLHLTDNNDFIKVERDYYLPNEIMAAYVQGYQDKKNPDKEHTGFRFVVEFKNKLLVWSKEFLHDDEAEHHLAVYLKGIGHELQTSEVSEV